MPGATFTFPPRRRPPSLCSTPIQGSHSNHGWIMGGRSGHGGGFLSNRSLHRTTARHRQIDCVPTHPTASRGLLVSSDSGRGKRRENDRFSLWVGQPAFPTLPSARRRKLLFPLFCSPIPPVHSSMPWKSREGGVMTLEDYSPEFDCTTKAFFCLVGMNTKK